MPSDPLLTARAADEALDVKLAAQRLQALVSTALADGQVTPCEAAEIERQAEIVYRESVEAKLWADEAHKVDAILDTLRRGGALNPTPYKLERLRAAGLDVVVSETTTTRGNDAAA